MKKHVYFLTLLFAVISFCFVNCGGGDGSDTGPQLNQNCETIDTIDGPMVICEDSCQSDEDKDCDDVKDSEDNCPDIFNPSQTDTDGDKIGDSCDNCPENDNTFQSDYDMDGIGDECDDDADGDGIENSSDNCDLVYNPDQANEDGDSCGDVCDDQKTDPTICIDTDKDGITDADDNCPTVANGPLAAETPGDNQDNTDAKFGDTEGNACDDDDDNDGIPTEQERPEYWGWEPPQHDAIKLQAVDTVKVISPDDLHSHTGGTETGNTFDPDDVDGDGLLDMILHFRISQIGLTADDVEVCLDGRSTDGTSFEGCDDVTPVGR